MPTVPTRLVIDTDPGIDDAVALVLAARSPEVEIVAVTTTYGNAALAETTRNARTALGLAGRPGIPVHPGADRPLSRPPVTGAAMHGRSGVGYAEVAAAPDVAPDPDVLVRVLRAATAPVTLLTMGPLTNLAHALDQDRAAVGRAVSRHLAMLGAFGERGAHDRLGDFNAWADPEAADLVLRGGLPTALIPLDVTRRLTLSPADVARLAAARDEVTRWLARALDFYVEAHRAARGLEGCVLNDTLTVGEAVSPEILRFAERRIGLDLDDGERRGHTREREGGVLIPVAVDVDVQRMRTLLQRVIHE